jgi:biopolymer transport protein ExbB
VALVLLAMSLATWIIILWKVLDQRAQRRQAKACDGFWHSADFAEGLDKLGASEGNPFRSLATEGREAARHILQQDGRTSPQLHDQLDLSDWIERSLRNSLDDFTARAQSGLTVLASIASTAPFVGLFGTVWGIMNSFIGIAQTQTTNLAVVAPGIAEALLATAIGLVAAIPAVVIYNIFARMIGSYKATLGDVAAQVLLLQSRDLDLNASAVKPVHAASKLRVG